MTSPVGVSQLGTKFAPMTRPVGVSSPWAVLRRGWGGGGGGGVLYLSVWTQT